MAKKRAKYREDLIAVGSVEASRIVQYEQGGGLEAGFLGALAGMSVRSVIAGRHQRRERDRKRRERKNKET